MTEQSQPNIKDDKVYNVYKVKCSILEKHNPNPTATGIENQYVIFTDFGEEDGKGMMHYAEDFYGCGDEWVYQRRLANWKKGTPEKEREKRGTVPSSRYEEFKSALLKKTTNCRIPKGTNFRWTCSNWAEALIQELVDDRIITKA